MTVPRKSDIFQEDLYPDTIGPEPALDAEEWFSGKDADPICISLKNGCGAFKGREITVVKKVLDVKSISHKHLADSDSGSASSLTVESLIEELNKLKAKVQEHEQRITELEGKS
ncbi:coronin-6-like [Heterodontus francisci]|uniref:coronin-6-like n=1 Tax=Heterodontus francisci TaxID=7792 RepID=UPI00355B0407